MEGKDLVMPDDVLNLAVGLGKKLVMGFLYTYPNSTHQEIADMLGTTRNNVAKVSTLMKSECGHMATHSGRTATHSGRTATPYLVKEIRKEEPPIKQPTKAAKIPTLSDVQAYAEKLVRPDLAEEFFHHNSEADWMTKQGQPITSWKSWFRGWAKRTPPLPAASKAKSKNANSMSMEDMLYAADAETQARKHNK